jgi:hypothetical protein
MPTINSAPQRTPEWFEARAGNVTGSRASDLLARIKTGEAAARRDYRLQLALERITNQPQEPHNFVSDAMQWGIDCEPLARTEYARRTGFTVRETGFVLHDTLRAGASLDGDVDGLRGILEIKCPKSTTHIDYLKSGVLPERYRAQVMHNMCVTNADFCDFVSFDPRLPVGLTYFSIRVMRPTLYLAAYETALREFLSEVDREVIELTELIE